jgi:ABC-type transport system involved in multi-copper enzyme maturation permease subunit
MNLAYFSITRVWQIASLTMLEAIRQKLFHFLLLLGVALMASSLLFREFNFGYSELKFIMDIGFGVIVLFGTVLAIVGMAQMFYTEIDNRTALTLLAKPVLKAEFLTGKLLGIIFVLLCFVVLMSLILAGLIYWREGILLEQLQQLEEVDGVQRILPWDVLYYSFLHWIRLSVLASITICVASFSSTNLYTVIVSFMYGLICQTQHVAHTNWGDSTSAFVKNLIWFLGLFFPNLQMFNLTDMGKSGTSLTAVEYISIVGYGGIYVLVFLGLSVWFFRNREI